MMSGMMGGGGMMSGGMMGNDGRTGRISPNAADARGDAEGDGRDHDEVRQDDGGWPSIEGRPHGRRTPVTELVTTPHEKTRLTRSHGMSWNLTANDLLVGVILHVLHAERDKTFRGCLTFLADPNRPIENALSQMLTTVHDLTGRCGWTDPTTGQPTRTHHVVAGAARALLNKSENERSSVVSSAVKFLNLYRDPIVAQNTETCDFALKDLPGGDRPVSLYLTTPPSDITRTRPLLRLLLNQLGRRLTETLDPGSGREPAPSTAPPDAGRVPRAGAARLPADGACVPARLRY